MALGKHAEEILEKIYEREAIRERYREKINNPNYLQNQNLGKGDQKIIQFCKKINY